MEKNLDFYEQIKNRIKADASFITPQLVAQVTRLYAAKAPVNPVHALKLIQVLDVMVARRIDLLEDAKVQNFLRAVETSGQYSLACQVWGRKISARRHSETHAVSGGEMRIRRNLDDRAA